MSTADRIKLVLAGAVGSAGLCGLLLAMDGHPSPWPWSVLAGVVTGLLVAFAVWPRR